MVYACHDDESRGGTNGVTESIEVLLDCAPIDSTGAFDTEEIFGCAAGVGYKPANAEALLPGGYWCGAVGAVI